MNLERNTIDPSDMNKEDRSFLVGDYKSKLSSIILDQLSLEQYIPLFHNAGIKDVEQFLAMTEKDFRSIGLQDPGDLCLLINCSKALKQHIATLNGKTSEQPSINGEEDDQDYYSIKSFSSFSFSQYDQNNASRISCSSSRDDITIHSLSSESIKRAIHAFDTYQSSPPVPPVPPLPPMPPVPSMPPPSVVRRNKQCMGSRPLSMPTQLPSFTTPPPDYNSASIFGRRLDRSRSMIIPREEEGREELPDYTCTVFKMGYVYVKKELDAPNKKSRYRAWRKLYVELWGTMLRVYRAAPSKNKSNVDYRHNYRWPYYYYHKYYYTPIFTISLAGAEAGRALDYFKRPNALRLTTQQGPQLLLRLSSLVEMISWIEHLQAAINISLDLEQRPMPKFITIPTRALTTSVLDPRLIELERTREQRRRDQRETLL